MTLLGPDLSNNNWASADEIAGWLDDCFKREGYSWLEHKVSQGAGYQDPYWPAVQSWCAANGVPLIGYHYASTEDPDAQVACWNANNGGPNVMIDFEQGSGDVNNFWALVAAFSRAGVTVRVSYIPHWYWQGSMASADISTVPGLISSSYYGSGTSGAIEYADAGGDSGSGWNSYGGATPVIWQFTDGAIIDGKSVDANAFRGSLGDLKTLLGIQGAFMALTDDQQERLLAAVLDIQEQLRGPGLNGWSQLGQNAQGKDLTVVDALATIKTEVTK